MEADSQIVDNAQGRRCSADPISPISLVAYGCGDQEPLEIVPAERWRDWMNETASHFANRCLPLLVANESGWWILNRDALTAVWDGGDSLAALRVTYDTPSRQTEFENMFESNVHAKSNFGYGILTWEIPYVFRTDPGYNLLARGPANLPKDGVCALEGLIETDWSVSTFTMNWKLTRPGSPVRFEAGEPICMIVPQRRHELEAVVPRTGELSENPDLRTGYHEFRKSRWSARLLHLLAAANHPGVGDVRGEWEKDYFRGRTPIGDPAPEHVTKRRLLPFEGG